MARSNRWSILFNLATTVALITSTRAAAQHNLSRGGYENISSLKDAIEVVKKQLTLDGKPEYAALITEGRLRDGIRTAIKGYEALPGKDGKPAPGTTDRWLKEIRPLCLKVADKGEWPPDCAFDGFYTLVGREKVPYDGLGLRLFVGTPKAKLTGFALPIVDLYFGHFAD
jgi:hypothetical protein